jgi:hypothetical protein
VVDDLRCWKYILDAPEKTKTNGRHPCESRGRHEKQGEHIGNLA